MRVRLIYKILIGLGTVLYFVGLYAEVNAISFVRHFIILGAGTYITGCTIWFFLRIKKPVKVPLNKEKYVSLFDAYIAFYFNNIILELLAFFFYCGLIFILISINNFRDSYQFNEVRRFIANDQVLREKIGEPTGIGYFFLASWNEQESKINIYGTNGSTTAIFKRYSTNSKSEIESATYN